MKALNLKKLFFITLFSLPVFLSGMKYNFEEKVLNVGNLSRITDIVGADKSNLFVKTENDEIYQINPETFDIKRVIFHPYKSVTSDSIEKKTIENRYLLQIKHPKQETYLFGYSNGVVELYNSNGGRKVKYLRKASKDAISVIAWYKNSIIFCNVLNTITILTLK